MFYTRKELYSNLVYIGTRKSYNGAYENIMTRVRLIR